MSMSKALINPTSSQQLARDHGRIQTLRVAIEKAQAKGNAQKAASLQEELATKLERVKAALADLDG